MPRLEPVRERLIERERPHGTTTVQYPAGVPGRKPQAPTGATSSLGPIGRIPRLTRSNRENS